LVIVLLVVYTYLGLDYMKQRRGLAALTSQMAEVDQALAQIPQPAPDLAPRLEAARASLAAERDAFSTRLSSTEIINIILKLADVSGLKTIPLTTQPWSTEENGEHSYDVLRLNLAVAGGFSQLVGFVSDLENGEMGTLILEDLRVNRDDGPVEDGAGADGTMPVTASLGLAVYAQALSPD